MGVKDFLYDTARQITGDIPKAVLCVPDMSKMNGYTIDQVIQKSDALRNSLLAGMSADGSSIMQTFATMAAGGAESTVASNNYLALEVQYNPSTIYLETVAGLQNNFSGNSMGDSSSQQMRQNTEPVATTLSVQLLFDAVNPQDSFMISNVAPTVGNAVSAVSNLVKGEYSVKNQMDGIMSLLTHPATRHVIFFWSKMCFQGELTSVSSQYKMFNTKGNPVRGEIRLTIRQSEDPSAKYENTYWEKAFDKAFGDSMTSGLTKSVSTASSVLSNSVLNLNI